MPYCRGHGEGQHYQGHMSVPAMPGSRFVVSKAKFILRGLEAVLDGPAVSLDRDQRIDRGSGWTLG